MFEKNCICPVITRVITIKSSQREIKSGFIQRLTWTNIFNASEPYIFHRANLKNGLRTLFLSSICDRPHVRFVSSTNKERDIIVYCWSPCWRFLVKSIASKLVVHARAPSTNDHEHKVGEPISWRSSFHVTRGMSGRERERDRGKEKKAYRVWRRA